MSQSQSSLSAPNLASTQAKYSARSPLVRFANRRFFQAMRSMSRQVEAQTVLDAGCGEGIVLSRLATPDRRLVVGVDLDLARARLARSNAATDRVGVADVQQLPFPSNAFDLIILLEVFEHVGDPDLALREAHRVSRRYLLASVPHEPWWRLGNMLRMKYLTQFGNTPEHIHHWSARGFRQFLARHFRIMETKLPFLWTFILAEKRI